jgi:hypothetical protein
MIGSPDRSEAAPYYFTYIDRISTDDILGLLHTQLDETLPLFQSISEPKSLHRYAPDKWSLRQVLNHVNDTERVLVMRSLWFARGLDTPLPSFDQEVCAASAAADSYSWASHVDEFRAIRQATLAFFRSLPSDAWMRRGIASDNPFTVRALAYIVAGHLEHHTAIVRERYI